MFSIQELISRRVIPGLEESYKRDVCATVLSEVLHTTVTPKSVVIKNEVLSVAVPPIVKSFLILKQGEVIETLASKNIRVQKIQ